MTQKYVNGVLVDMTTEEIAARTAEEAANLAASKIPALAAYRDLKSNVYTYKNVPMQLGVGARHDLSTLWFAALVNTSLPDNTVMAVWQEAGYSDLNLTAGDLRTDGATIMGHYQKCWAAFAVVKADIADYNTIAEIQEAFDTAYAA